MARVASLYLPHFAIERLRAGDARRAGKRPEPVAAAADRILAGPATKGWRPGADWARRDPGVTRADIAAQIEAMPDHRRPPMRELGRRSEPVAAPFRRSPRDGAAELAAPDPALPVGRRIGSDDGGSANRLRAAYDLTGAFWQSPHQIAGEIRDGMNGEHALRDRLPAAPRRTRPSAAAALPLLPLVTVQRDGPKMVIAAACPVARAAGLSPGMALTFARALVPDLDVRDADALGDSLAIRRLAIRAARAWSPVAAADGSDGLWLDMSVAPLFGGEARMARAVLAWLARRGFTGRMAVAGSAGAAHALARHGGQKILLCPSDGEKDALAALPVAGLRLDAASLMTLGRLGLTRIGQLADLPRGPLARRFGATLVARLDQALGRRGEAIEAVVPPDRTIARRRFAEPIATAEAIATVLADLVAELIATLAARGQGARRLALVCRRIDGRDEVAAIGTARATRDARHLLRLLMPKIETIDPGFGIEAMWLDALCTDPLGPQALSTLAEERAPDLAPLIDLLAGRLGARRLYRLGARESDVPERSVAALPAIGLPPPPHPVWPRPARLFEPPERIDNIIAELPDRAPIRFSWRGTHHRVIAADGPERIYGEWWRDSAEADAVRDYFQVEEETGHRFWLFRRGDGSDPRTGDMSWWIHGLFG